MSAVAIYGAVEGYVDEAVLQRLVTHVGAEVGTIYGKTGKEELLRRLPAYCNAARTQPWVVLVDLDHSWDCAPQGVSAWLPEGAPFLCFRIAVRQVESWLLADWERFASFLAVRPGALRNNPETLPDAKRMVVDLARKSRRKAIQKDMVPRPGSGRSVGPAYTSRLIEFIGDGGAGWRPEIASLYSDSLHRCLRCLRRLAEAGGRV